jgi:hypothetical protein
MKIKNIQIMKAEKALEGLISLKLPLKVKTNYKLSKISIAIRNESSALEVTKNQILAKYLKEGETFSAEHPNFQVFFREWREVAEMETEVNIDKIKLEEIDIEGVTIPIDILRDLDPFIEQ